MDLKDIAIEEEEGIKEGEKFGCPHFRVSAKTGQNLEDAFQSIFDQFMIKALSAPEESKTDKRKNIRDSKLKTQGGFKLGESDLDSENSQSGSKRKRRCRWLFGKS